MRPFSTPRTSMASFVAVPPEPRNDPAAAHFDGELDRRGPAGLA
jgi:hypothetical protein